MMIAPLLLKRGMSSHVTSMSHPGGGFNEPGRRGDDEDDLNECISGTYFE
jgi:hypothetical protein